MIDINSRQLALKNAGFYKGAVDGDFGKKSQAAMQNLLAKLKITNANWPTSRKLTALDQWIMREAGINAGAIDGLIGPQTLFGYEQWQDALRDLDPDKQIIAKQPQNFPRQKDMAAFYGKPGENHVLLQMPYPMRLAWDKNTSIQKFTINAKCSESAGRAFAKVFDHYGYNKIRSLGLDLFGGCFNNRNMRGGKSLSTHAYAAALDINPMQNQLRWNSDKAAMAKKDCAPFLDAFAAEGWISLGRERNYDWMHLQAARL